MLKRISILAAGLILQSGMGYPDAASDQAYQAGVAAYTAADYQGAIKNAEAAVASDPQNWQAWQLDGNARYALGDKAGAITVYKYALQINPGNTQLKTFVDSLEGAPAQPAVAASPAEAAYQAGVAAYTAADYDNAMKESAAAVRADPNHWQAWSLLGNCRYARTDKRGALEAYDKSLALHPDQPQLKPFRDQLAQDPGAQSAAASSAIAAPARESAIAEGADHDEGRKYGLAVGYGLVGLAAPAALLEAENAADAADWVADFGGKASGTVSKPAGFPSVSLSAEQPLPGRPFGVAGRFGFFVPGSLTSDYSATGAVGETEKQTATMDFLFYSIEVGGFARYRLPGGIWLRGNLFIGYAAMDVDYSYNWEYKDSFWNLKQKGTIPMSGSTITVAAEAEVDYKLAARWTLFGQAGYLLANVNKALTTKDVDADGDGRVDVKASYGLVDKKDEQIAYDFSGVNLRAGIKYTR